MQRSRGRGRWVRVDRLGSYDLRMLLGAPVGLIVVLTPADQVTGAALWLQLGDDREVPPLPLHLIRRYRFEPVARAQLEVEALPSAGSVDLLVAGADVFDVEPA